MPVTLCSPATSGNTAVSLLLESLVIEGSRTTATVEVGGHPVIDTTNVTVMGTPTLDVISLNDHFPPQFWISQITGPLVSVPNQFPSSKANGQIFGQTLEVGNPGTVAQSNGVQVCLRVPFEYTAKVYPLPPPTIVP